jgi:hypothetical protein
MRVLLVGCGVVGARATRQLLNVPGVDRLVIDDVRSDRVNDVVTSMGGVSEALGQRTWNEVAPDVVILAGPAGHKEKASRALRLGAHVVSVSDAVSDIRALRGLHDEARSSSLSVLMGVGFAPGLSCLLAKHGAVEFESIDEIHVAKTGTAGPACARQHHDALKGDGIDWRDGGWVSKPGGSGRELCWFPDPIGGADCYRAALADPILLHEVFPSASRITSRMSATRRDRLTSRLPMMRQPHPEAGPGAVRVELRGPRQGISDVVIFGCMDRPSVASGAVIAVATGAVVSGSLLRFGAGGLAEMLEPAPVLLELAARGVKCARFDGVPKR